MLGDSLVANKSRYPIVWDQHLENLNVVNCGIRGDYIQNVLWSVEHMYLPAAVSVGLIHCGINVINSTYIPHEIAEIYVWFQAEGDAPIDVNFHCRNLACRREFGVGSPGLKK